MPEVITDNLDLWTSALLTKSTAGRGSNGKLETYGIKKLRELILELAVRGKLVPQDHNDEPASILLEKIAKEKARLIREGKIKQEKPLAEVDAIPYELPANWEWARLPSIASYKPGKTPSTKNPSYWSDNPADVPWVSISDMEHFGVLTETSKKITSEAAEKVFGYEPIPKGSLLMSFKLTVGKMAILGLDAYHNEAILSIQPYSGIARDYLFKVLPARAQAGNTKRAIMGDTLNATSLSLLLIPVPSLAEQHRIVAKVDELMALCDQLEQQQTDSLAAHLTLVETLLGALTRVESQQEFSTAWARIASHFDTLFTTEASIDQLKQTILQLAVMGKLVPQDPNDEPASALLKRIQAEKARLIAEGKIKKDKPLPPIVDNEKPFELPKSWAWVKPEEFSIKITDGEHFRPQIEESGVYFLSAKDVREEGVSFDDPLFISKETARKAMQRCNPEYGDLLIVSRGATVGRMCKVNTHEKFCLLGSVILVKPTTLVLSDYLSISLKSPSSFSKLINASGSTAQPAIYLKDLKGIAFPLPPIEEQHRIVTKVDELMALCDALKARLADAQATQLHLADAIVEQAVCWVAKHDAGATENLVRRRRALPLRALCRFQRVAG